MQHSYHKSKLSNVCLPSVSGYPNLFLPLSAVFDGCPRLKKKFGNPQNANTHGSIKEWADCALKCEADKDCKVRQMSLLTCIT